MYGVALDQMPHDSRLTSSKLLKRSNVTIDTYRPPVAADIYIVQYSSALKLILDRGDVESMIYVPQPSNKQCHQLTLPLSP